VPGSGLELEPEVVMNNSPSNLEKTQRGPGGRVKHWDHRQNAGVMEAPGSNVKKVERCKGSVELSDFTSKASQQD